MPVSLGTGFPEPESDLGQEYTVRDIPLYSLEPGRTLPSLPPDVQYLVFASAGDVRHFLEAYKNVPENAVCVCIGEVTARALAGQHGRPFLTAPEISVDGIVAAILRHRGAGVN